MERAARIFQNKKLTGELLNQEGILRAAWPVAVGKIIAAHTGRIRLVRQTLVVEVEDAIWQRQLFSLSGQILHRLGKVAGKSELTAIEFRVGAPRIQPQRALSEKSAPLLGDEADGIQDPVLKKVYQMSRRKASA